MTADLLIGIGSSAIFAALVWIYSSQLRPRIEGALQKVPHISGRWDIIATNENRDNLGHIEVNQRGSRIKAKMYRRRKTDDTVREFESAGNISSGQLVLTFEEKAFKGHNFGSTVLKLSSDGRQFQGMNVYLHHDSGEIRAVPTIWKKQIAFGSN